MGKVRVRAVSRIRNMVTAGVIDGVCGVVRKKVLPKNWYRYWQYFSVAVLVLVSAILFAKVLVLVLAILFTSIVNNHVNKFAVC